MKIKQTMLLIGDIVLLYASLFAMLFIRYGSSMNEFISSHLGPFSIVFIFWIIVFYIIGMYDIYVFKDTITLLQNLIVATVIGMAIAIISFYIIPYLSIAPKTNLVIFSIIFIFTNFIWRKIFQSIFKTPQKIAMVLGGDKDVAEMEKMTLEYPHIGYKIIFHFTDKNLPTPDELNATIDDYKINTIITMRQLEPSDDLFDAIYHSITKGIEVVEFSNIYERIFKKVPVSEIKHMWILTSISKQHRMYDIIKHSFEFILSVLLFILLSPMLFIIWLVVIITSSGGAIYSQERIGKNNTHFTLYKFRTMKKDAEEDGAQWATKNDPRTTLIGKFLRYSHLDELPQLINIMKGNISFVGPRPERPEFVKTLSKKIPYYEIRHLINPGITGWAQVNYKYGASIEDAYQKLQYDIYYIKHRSMTIDMLSVLRTIKMLLFNYK